MCHALRYYATGGNYRLVGEAMHTTPSTVDRCVDEVTDFLVNFVQEFIQLPTTFDQLAEKATGFYRKYGKPMVFGNIDGTHMAIDTPAHNDHLYVNRKGYHSLNAMVKCLKVKETIKKHYAVYILIM